ncbi:MAG: GNAT family protein [Planctomycetota bacterium]
MALFRNHEHDARGLHVLIRCPVDRDAAGMIAHAKRSTEEGEHYLIEWDEHVQTIEGQLERIRRYREGEYQVAFVAIIEVDGEEQLIGEISFRTLGRRRANHRGMFGISVAAAYQGRGIGRAMIQHLLDWACKHPTIEIVALGCYAENTRAQKLYREIGFVEEGRAVDMFKTGPGEYHDDVIMTLRVKPREVDR